MTWKPTEPQVVQPIAFDFLELYDDCQWVGCFDAGNLLDIAFAWRCYLIAGDCIISKLEIRCIDRIAITPDHTFAQMKDPS
jgi:hypothetical protein